MTRGERVIAFITRFCRVPEGKLVGQPLVLMEFQRNFILDVFDNPSGTSRAYLSIARKNAKTTLIAAIAWAYVVGPEARLNSQIIAGARSREQAGLVFKLMQKMRALNPELAKITRVVPSQKQIFGLVMNVEFRAISAEAGTAHGLSPVLAILDEVGQIKGPQDDFVEAIETAQGAHDNPLLIAISTQAATDVDLFSQWLDDAEKSKDPHIVSHVYTAKSECDLMDRAAWMDANPALGEFRSLADMEQFADQAKRMPSKESSFRWLFLNQRVEAASPFISKNAWKACAAPVVEYLDGRAVYGGLDLSEVADLTAFVAVTPEDGGWDAVPTFWLPEDGIHDKARADRVPYGLWADQGFLNTTPGRTIDYDFVAAVLFELAERADVRRVAFDRFNMRHLKPRLRDAGFSEDQLEGDDAIFKEFGQGFASMSPALRSLETVILNGKLRHAGHPVLEMCAKNAVVVLDPAGNRKLTKAKSRGRIDGMVALAMALSVAETYEAGPVKESYLDTMPLMVL